jgi:hypothetical protein
MQQRWYPPILPEALLTASATVREAVKPIGNRNGIWRLRRQSRRARYNHYGYGLNIKAPRSSLACQGQLGTQDNFYLLTITEAV